MSLCIKERHCPIFIVEEHTHNPGPLEEMQQLCLPCTCPVLTAPPQTDGPIAILWSQRDHSLSAHWLSSHTHIPRCFVSHVYLPVVPPCGETLCSKKRGCCQEGGLYIHTNKQKTLLVETFSDQIHIYLGGKDTWCNVKTLGWVHQVLLYISIPNLLSIIR